MSLNLHITEALQVLDHPWWSVRVPWQCVDLCQWTRTKLSQEFVAQSSHRRDRSQKIISNTARACSSTGFVVETMVTGEWVRTWWSAHQWTLNGIFAWLSKLSRFRSYPDCMAETEWCDGLSSIRECEISGIFGHNTRWNAFVLANVLGSFWLKYNIEDRMEYFHECIRSWSLSW